MKRKFLKNILLCSVIALSLSVTNVKAKYNGSGTPDKTGTGTGSCEASSKPCAYNNNSHITIKVSLFYFKKGGGRSQIGDSIFLTSSSKTDMAEKLGLNESNLDNFYQELNSTTYFKYYSLPRGSEKHYENIEEKYFNSGGKVSKTKVKKVLGWINDASPGINIDLKSLDMPSLEACTLNGAEYGYRLIIEPAYTMTYKENGKRYVSLLTTKQMATKGVSNGGYWVGGTTVINNASISLYTKCNDVGISMVASKGSSPRAIRDTNIIKNPNTGYGYNIIDITSVIDDKYCPEPYDTSINLTSCIKEGKSYDECVKEKCGPPDEKKCEIKVKPSLPTCSGKSTTNGGSIFEVAEGAECKKEYTGNKNNYYGVPTKTNVGSYCQTYCLKEIDEIYPGNIAKAVNAGRYIVWPNNNIGNQNKINAKLTTYPLQLQLHQVCRVMVDQNKFKTDYQQASNDELNNYQVNDGYGNLVGTVYVNSGKTCSWYQKNQSNMQNEYTNATSLYDKCVNNSKDNKGKTHPENCLSQKNQRESSKNELDKASEALSMCNSYASSYERANKILKEFNTCLTSNFTTKLDLKADYSVDFEGEGEFSGDYELYESGSKKDCKNCEGLAKISFTADKYRYFTNSVKLDIQNKITQIENRVIDMNITKTYDLKEEPGTGNYYYFVNKDKNISTNLSGRGNNYSTIGFSNLPIAYSSIAGKKYNIKLKLNNFESNSISDDFKDEFTKQDYACKYEVTKTPNPPSCICPSGTKHEGESLDCLLANLNENGKYKYTCADAKYIYCDDDSINPDDLSCPPNEDLTCPNDPSMDLSFCINEGYSYNYCADTFCNNGTPNNPNDPNGPNNPNDPNGPNGPGGKHYYCPKGTSNEGMNLDACVIPMILKGTPEAKAYEYCKDVTCPYKGIKIIYRTISLQNPFPSYDADKSITQTGLKEGMFNDTIKGRYPGSNWNSTKLVHDKILNNRGVDGDEVYKKEPLYTFKLTPEVIKNIRSYNKAQKDKYSDFNLRCLNKNSTACVSDFVHNASYGITKGVCNKKLTAGNFYTCVND